MNIAILTFDEFNEIDSFVSHHILTRVDVKDWNVAIASPSATVTSTGGWAGYIPDLRSAAYGGYGADASTNIEVGAGEKIMLRHLTNLYELKGMWFAKPGQR